MLTTAAPLCNGAMIDLTRIQRLAFPSDGGPGWRVELPENEVSFPDSEPGGTLAALLRAVRWRDQAEGRKPTSVDWTSEALERVDRGGVHGWWVSAMIRKDVLDADLFEDEAHGGARDALLAALEWRQAREGRRRRTNRRGRRR